MNQIKDRLQQAYSEIKNDCAITTAASKDFGIYLLNMLSSLHENFPNHPKVYVFDLGLTSSQRSELKGIPWVELREVPAFCPFYKLCWTWKPYIWNQPKQRYVLHIDSGVVVLRSLELWFLAIKKHGYLAFTQGQVLSEITPFSYLELSEFKGHKINLESQIFAAGVFGFDLKSKIGDAVREALDLAKKGLTLGWSKKEFNRAKHFQEKVYQDCDCFRHDQTLINLCLRKQIANPVIRPLKKYLGVSSARDHVRQYLWHARRKPSSLTHLWNNESADYMAFLTNRARYSLGKLKHNVFGAIK
ncbi:MAG: hypothetical protein AB7F43_03815 [Bacteriovoracia bacterium]